MSSTAGKDHARGVKLTAQSIDTDSGIPSLHDVIAAREHVYRHLQPTPLRHYPALSDLVGTDIWVKHENYQPTGAFKVRGGLNLVATMPEEERAGGLFTASTGNHGQSISFGAKTHGIQANVFVPVRANPGKVASMRAMGANVVEFGADFDEAREGALQTAENRGGRFVGPTDEPLICGVGTYTLELIEALPDVDTIIVPFGCGSGTSSVCIVAKAINPAIEVIAVQSAQAPAMQQSWKAGHSVEAQMETFAEGIATRVPVENTQRIIRKHLDEFVLVDDEAIRAAIVHYLEHARTLAEGAGAAPLAAAIQLREQLAGKKVALILSGGNLALYRLKEIMAAHEE
jgi:threonine dehydratase